MRAQAGHRTWTLPSCIGELFLDPSREARVGGRRVELANKEFGCIGPQMT